MGGHENCPLMALILPAYGHRFCPRDRRSGTIPLPEGAAARQKLSPAVMTTWAWCRSRSTVAVARVFGMSSSQPAGCRVRGDRHRATLVGRVDEPVEPLGRVRADREHPDVVDDHEVRPQHPRDRSVNRVVGPVPATRHRPANTRKGTADLGFFLGSAPRGSRTKGPSHVWFQFTLGASYQLA